MNKIKAADAGAFRYFDTVTAVFVGVLIVSNVASSAKIVDLRASLFSIPLIFDGGTLLFPISYVFGDILTEVYGFRASRKVIWTGFLALAASSLLFMLLGALPGDASWEKYAGDAAYNAIMGGMASGGLLAASLSGYFAGEFSNSTILSRLKIVTDGRFLWVRTIGSTLVGELVDSVFFVTVASACRVFPWASWTSLVVTNYILKTSIEIVMTPFTYFIVFKLKHAEGKDVYDVGVKYNPFGLAVK
jgi:uncharacterized integral membrane protein (TIGR00697 family)